MTKDSNRHPPDALLHAYASGDVDPAQRAAISAHLHECPVCMAAHRRVIGVRNLFQEMTPPGLDDLKWRRISQNVMNRLEEEALSDQRSWTSWIESIFQNHKTALAMAAGALGAIAIAFWLAPQRDVPATQHASTEEVVVESAHTITSGASPFHLTLPQGVTLHLSENARLLARSTVPPNIDLELQLGELDVMLFEPLPPMQSLKIRTPAFVATTRATDFSVGYRASESFVQVRKGEVDIEGPLFGGKTTIREGERRVVRVVDERAAITSDPNLSDPAPQAIETRPTADDRSIEQRIISTLRPKHESPPVVEQVAPAPEKENIAEAALEPAIESGSVVPSAAEVEAQAIRSSSEGETKVAVVAPPQDSISRAWQDASEAYYRARNLDRAIERASWIVEKGGARSEALLAKNMLCEAYIATRQPENAVNACERLLPRAGEEEARGIHYKLGTIFRTQLHDCKTAITHYTRSIVFGRGSMLDDEAHLWRAHCALEIGDLESARWDISTLETRAAALARPKELYDLKARLIAALAAREKGTVDGSADSMNVRDR